MSRSAATEPTCFVSCSFPGRLMNISPLILYPMLSHPQSHSPTVSPPIPHPSCLTPSPTPQLPHPKFHTPAVSSPIPQPSCLTLNPTPRLCPHGAAVRALSTLPSWTTIGQEMNDRKLCTLLCCQTWMTLLSLSSTPSPTLFGPYWDGQLIPSLAGSRGRLTS